MKTCKFCEHITFWHSDWYYSPVICDNCLDYHYEICEKIDKEDTSRIHPDEEAADFEECEICHARKIILVKCEPELVDQELCETCTSALEELRKTIKCDCLYSILHKNDVQ